jgi:hypothetical protein
MDTNSKLYLYFLTSESFLTNVAKEINSRSPKFEISGLSTIPLNEHNKFNFKQLSFLKDIKYKKEKVDFEYLSKIEKEYNFTISELLHFERYSNKLNHTEKLCYVEGFIRIIEKDFANLNFDIILSAGLSDGVSYFLYLFSLKRGIKFIYLIPNRLSSDYYFSDHPDSGPINFKTKFHQNLELYKNDKNKFTEVINFIKNYIKFKNQPGYLKDNTLIFKYFSFNDAKTILKVILNKNKRLFHGETNIFKLIFQRFSKFKQKKIYQKLLKVKFDYSKTKFFIFPLQFHPESATIILGKWFHNQIEIIKMISRVLPLNYFLIVKEHPHSIGRRPSGFYDSIAQFHNVRLIDSSISVNELINNSLGVVTISSTMGLEAILLNKPLILFGDVHYSILKDIIKVHDFKKIEQYLHKALHFEGYNENEYWALFKTITEKTITLENFSPHNFNEYHIQIYVDFLFDEINYSEI